MNKAIYPIVLLVVFAVAGYGIGKAALEKYESIGVVAFDMDLPEYRRGYELASNVDTLQRYLNAMGPAKSEVQAEAIAYLHALAVGRDPLRRNLSPIYRTTRADVRDIGEVKENTKNPQRPIIGLRISVTHETPAVAQESVRILAEFFRQSVLREMITRYVGIRSALVAESAKRAEADIAKLHFDIEQARTKIADLKQIVRNYPQAAAVDSRQVVNVGNGTERFLSPVAQLVAEEARVIDLQLDDGRLQRSQRQFASEERLLDKLRTIDPNGTRGDVLLDKATEAARELLTPSSPQDDATREILANYSADLAEMRGRWLDRTQFLGQPSLPTEPSGVTARHAAVALGFVGVMLGLLVAYGGLLARSGRSFRAVFSFSQQKTP